MGTGMSAWGNAWGIAWSTAWGAVTGEGTGPGTPGWKYRLAAAMSRIRRERQVRDWCIMAVGGGLVR